MSHIRLKRGEASQGVWYLCMEMTKNRNEVKKKMPSPSCRIGNCFAFDNVSRSEQERKKSELFKRKRYFGIAIENDAESVECVSQVIHILSYYYIIINIFIVCLE